MASNLEHCLRLRESYRNKVIFITGASGFIGKVLIEKLLRSCPDLKEIYLLMRPKKGLTIDARLNQITNYELFSKLNEEGRSDWKQKLKVVNGDVTELNLGLSEEDRKTLIENVNIVFHIAASVRFDDPLKSAIIMNTRGAREACNLALEMKRIEMFFHVSTTYCNFNREIVDEVIYPPIGDWKEMINVAENLNLQELEIMSTKLIGQFPNTYTFTKNLSEHVVNDLLNERVPAIIFRPSIVISSVNDPFPGWIDNFNGPVGLLIVCGKGILRTNWTEKNIKQNYVPVDNIVKLMILTLHHRMTREDEESLKRLEVYNASADLKFTVTNEETVQFGKDMINDVPLKNPLWYPSGDMTSSKTYYFIDILLIHLLPALFVDVLLKITGNKPMLFNLQKKIYVANTAFHHFLNREWIFVKNKMQAIRNELHKDDYDDFHVETEINQREYFRNATIGVKKFLLHEDINDLDKHRQRMFQMKILHYVTITIISMLFVYLLYSHLHLVNRLINSIVSYYNGIEIS